MAKVEAATSSSLKQHIAQQHDEVIGVLNHLSGKFRGMHVILANCLLALDGVWILELSWPLDGILAIHTWGQTLCV